MLRLRAIVLIGYLSVALCANFAPGQTDVHERVDFVSQIRPILSDKCFACHGPDAGQRDSELRLDQEASVKSDLGGYRAVVPGDPTRSELVLRISAEDENERMPPPDSGKSLNDDQIALLTRWIQQGAQWQEHWAYVDPQKTETPNVSRKSWPKHWIDHYVLARMEIAGVDPALPADRHIQIRRLYLDLIGLPPSPQAVEAFVNDSTPQALEKVVETLLASEHYGERMAMYWLDLVRYADTVGYHGDQDHHISPYRDWVIDALNDNMPFDQFTRDQLAGDLLPGSSTDQKIAAAYNRLLQTSHEGGVQPGEYLAIYAADRVRNVSAVWMGATMGCAQCHDHKYDPYTTRDFYSMAAFFADIDDAAHLTKGADTVPTKRLPEIKVFTRRERAAISQLVKEIDRLQRQQEEVDDSDDSDDSFRRQIETLKGDLQRIRSAQRTIMLTRPLKTPRETRILPRGDWLDRTGEVVLPGVPSFLGTLSSPSASSSGETRASRLDLANWLTDPAQGGKLTARVLVNRLWFLFFGSGLSNDLADFGGQGQPPTHPQLLDRLALELIESGWDLKHVVRVMVTSQTYLQSSVPTAQQLQRDPQNRWFSRQNRFRLPAETIRDNALETSGLLVRDIGGPSVKPYQPAGYYRHLNFPQRTYQADLTPHKQWRRGLYVHWQRQFLQPMLKAFDAPMREECTAQRPRSNTPTAALTLLNDPTFVEAASAFAQRILDEGGDTFPHRLERAFLLALNRPPSSAELDTLRQLYDSEIKQLATGTPGDRQPDLVYQPAHWTAEHSAWMSIARVLLNLNEAITRN